MATSTGAPSASLAAAPTIAALMSAYPSLPRSERRVADYILGHATEIPLLTSTELGRLAGVSQSIVSRLCTLVYDTGYSGLRLGLAHDLAIAAVDAGSTESSGLPDPLLSRTEDDLQIAERAIALLDHERLQQAAWTLCEATGVVTCGMAFSGAVSQRLANLLHLEGVPARFEREPYSAPYGELGFRAGTVLVVTSYRGVAPGVVGIVEHAKAEGAAILLLTNEERSPLARTADLVLATSAPSATSDAEWATGASGYVQLALARAVWLAVVEGQGRRRIRSG